MEGLVKIGLWGGGSDELRDIAVAPHRLESVCRAFVAGRPGCMQVKLGKAEVITEISGTYGPFGEHACVVRSLTFVTNVGKHGPFGNAGEGTPFTVALQDAARVVGFFGRSGRLLDAIGIYVHP